MASNVSTRSRVSVARTSLTSGIGGVWDLERGFVVENPSRRPQAGPLPKKPGEIGYEETAQNPQVDTPASTSPTEGSGLLGRHPADRDSSSAPTTPATPSTQPITPVSGITSATQDTPSSDASSVHSAGKHSLMSFLKPKQLPKVGGISLGTLLRLFVHVFFIVGTIVGWAMIVQHVPHSSDSVFGLSTTQVFIHVTFVIATLMQLIFFERIIFRVRAERYAYKHPGQVLPTSRQQRSAGHGNSGPSMGFAPWNRPPLPTYAAALAANGHGTGDVEDNIIAVPPPPAYGNTRGSTLLLAGLMPENLRAQRTRERVRSETTVRGSLVSRISRMTTRSSRPVSYRSRDSAWEERMDADRAIVLEETLAKLEEGK